MTFFSLSGLATAISSIVMALVMLFGGGKRIHIIWLLFCASMTMLGVSMLYLGQESTTAENALAWWRFAYIGVLNLPMLTFIAAAIVLERKHLLKKSILGVFLGITFLFHIENFAGDFINVVTRSVGGIWFDMPMTVSFKVFLAYFNITFSWILFLIFTESFHAKKVGNKELQQKAKFLGVGISTGIIGGIAVYLPLFGMEIYPYASILMGFYPIIIGYAILRHRLFDARYAILQVTRIITIIALSLFLSYGLYRISVEYIHYTPRFYPIETGIGIICVIFTICFARSQRISNFFLISSLAALERETEAFLKKKGVYKNVSELQSDLEGLFYRGSKIQKVQLINDASTLNYPHVIHYFQKYRKPLILSELENEDVEGESTALIGEVGILGEAIFPIENIGEKGFFFLILGKKESEEQLTEKEVRIINRILPKIALAFQVLEYNKSLQDEVKRQTQVLNKKNKELQIANEKLQEVDRNKDNFLAIASHELRSPMTVIKGYSDLFLKDEFGPMTDTAKSHMKRIYSSTIQLIDLVNNILDILTTDESKFIILCNNLLSNAYKFTEGGTVHVEAWNSQDVLSVSVTDTGKGIEPKRLPHIFEKFTQTDSTSYTKKSIRGSGLGLYLCHLLVGLLGGSITAQSKLNAGSTFTFSLPLHDSHIS